MTTKTGCNVPSALNGVFRPVVPATPALVSLRSIGRKVRGGCAVYVTVKYPSRTDLWIPETCPVPQTIGDNHNRMCRDSLQSADIR